MKTLGYYLFALVYNLCRPFPIIKKRVLCIMTHDDGEASNVRIAARAMQDKNAGYTFSYITKSNTQAVKRFAGLTSMISFFFLKPYEMARAEIVLLDNIFLPYAYLHRKKNTKVVQLWHGTGSIKKFGQDVNVGKLKILEQRANTNVTHLIVNSQAMQKMYAGAFGIEEKDIYPIGLPKTDELLARIKEMEATQKNQSKEEIYHKYQIPLDKKLILYAPTFRDNEIENPKVVEFVKEICQKLPEEYYIGIRLHPFIAKEFGDKVLSDSRICQFSFESDVNTLLLASDLLITDYSSIIFEYCLTGRPMIFFAYDYTEFSDKGRGFYHNYIDYVPGIVAYSTKEVIDTIERKEFHQNCIKGFTEDNYAFLDGKATERLIELIQK